MFSPNRRFFAASVPASTQQASSTSTSTSTSTSSSSSLSVWDVARASLVYATPGPALCAALSDSLLAYASASALLVAHLALPAIPVVPLKLPANSLPPVALAFSLSQRMLAVLSASAPASVSVVLLSPNADVLASAHIKTPLSSASRLCFSDNDQSLVIAGARIVRVSVRVAGSLSDPSSNPPSLSLSAEKDFSAHATPCTDIIANANLCASSARQDRFIFLWNLSRRENLGSLTLDSPPIQLAASELDHVLAVTDSGTLAVWSPVKDLAGHATENGGDLHANKKSKSSSRQQQHRPTISRPPDSIVSISAVSVDKNSKVDSSFPARPVSILAGAFSSKSADSIIIAFGSHLRPSFETVSVLKRDHSDNVDEDDNTLFNGNIEIIRAEKGGKYIALNDLSAKQLTSSTKKYAERANARVITSTTSLAMNISSSGAADAADEPTLQERISTLSVSTAPPVSSAPETQSRKSGRPFQPTATSLYALLSQAIQSGDKQLLEQCLQVSDPVVITASVKRLPAAHVVPLVEMLVRRMQIRPSRAARLVEWIRAVVLCHAAFLMTSLLLIPTTPDPNTHTQNPSLSQHLGSLHAALTSRVDTFAKLLKLSGRLDLVSSQIALRAARAQFDDGTEDDDDDNSGRDGAAAATVYDEEDEAASGEDDDVNGNADDDDDEDEDDDGAIPDSDEDDDAFDFDAMDSGGDEDDGASDEEEDEDDEDLDED
ncbi:WD repeat-containing protein 43 [Entophlyctis sp. JEL0112]|nr:WD repeat-containing protein 43 [Entophlyctis sp. JEL0112]